MSDLQSWLNTLGPYAALLPAVWGAYQAWQARRIAGVAVGAVRQIDVKVDAVADKVEIVHLATNSIVSAALNSKDRESAARVGEADALGAERGRVQGRDEEIARQTETGKGL